MKSEEKRIIRDLIANAKITEAIEILKSVCTSDDQLSQVIPIQSAYKKIEHEHMHGVIKDDVYRLYPYYFGNNSINYEHTNFGQSRINNL